MTPKHKECQKELLEIGRALGLVVDRGEKLGKVYHMGCPDVVWYYDCSGKEPLMKIAEGDRCKAYKDILNKNNIIERKECRLHGNCQYLPLVAFGVSNEDEKALRGSLVTLQVVNAAASIIVLIGKTDKEFKSFAKKLVRRFSFTRLRIWTEKDVDKLYNKVVKKEGGDCTNLGIEINPWSSIFIKKRDS